MSFRERHAWLHDSPWPVRLALVAMAAALAMRWIVHHRPFTGGFEVALNVWAVCIAVAVVLALGKAIVSGWRQTALELVLILGAAGAVSAALVLEGELARVWAVGAGDSEPARLRLIGAALRSHVDAHGEPPEHIAQLIGAGVQRRDFVVPYSATRLPMGFPAAEPAPVYRYGDFIFCYRGLGATADLSGRLLAFGAIPGFESARWVLMGDGRVEPRTGPEFRLMISQENRWRVSRGLPPIVVENVAPVD